MLAAFAVWADTGDPAFAAAVRAAWEVPDRPPQAASTTAIPRQAGATAHTPTTGTGEEAHWQWADRVIGALERVKANLGVALEDRLPPWRNRWEHPGCGECDRGFVEVDDGVRVVPCPVCRAARAGDARD